MERDNYVTLRNDMMRLISIVQGDHDPKGKLWETQIGNKVQKWRRKGHAPDAILRRLSWTLHIEIKEIG